MRSSSGGGGPYTILIMLVCNLHPLDAAAHLIDGVRQFSQTLFQPDQEKEGHHHGKTVRRC